MANQSAGLFGDAQGAQEMARVVIGDRAPIGSAHILDPKHIHQKLAQFEAALPDRPGAVAPADILGKQLRVVVLDHADARPRRAHDHLGILEYSDEPFGRRLRRPAISGVEGRLSAAGLIHGAVHIDPQPPEQGQHGLAHLGIEAVHQALDEQGYAHGSKFRFISTSVGCKGFEDYQGVEGPSERNRYCNFDWFLKLSIQP